MPNNTVETEKLKLYLGIESTMGTFGNVMYSRAVNEYSSFSEGVNVVARDYIGNDRMEGEGTITSKEHKIGIKLDLTQNNTQDIFPASLFANMVESPATNPLYSTATPLTSMNTTQLVASGGGMTKFNVGDLIATYDFPTDTNNGVFSVTAVTSTAVTVSGTLTADTFSSGAPKIKRVGHVFGSGDVSIAYTSGNTTGTLTATTTSTIFQDLGIVSGMILILDAQDISNAFANNRGYIRVRSVSTVSSNSVITFDATSFTPVTESGTGKAIRIWWEDYVKNGTGTAIVDKTLSALRVSTISTGDEWDIKQGSGIDKLSIDIPKPEANAKVELTIDAMCMKTQRYSASDSKPSATLNNLSELKCYSSAKEIISSRFYKRTGATTPFPTKAIGYVSDGSLEISNSVSIPTAWGSTDGFDVNKGKIKVSGDVNAYYASDAIETAIGNKDMFGLALFFGRPLNANYSEGIFIDVPYLQASTEGKGSEKDGIIMLPLKITSVRDPYINNVISVSYFRAMPRHILTALGAE